MQTDSVKPDEDTPVWFESSNLWGKSKLSTDSDLHASSSEAETRSESTSSTSQQGSSLHHQIPVVFDRNHALKRLGGLDSLLNDVLELVHTETPKALNELTNSLRIQDSIKVKRAAHTLKGTAGLVGANNLLERLATVEKQAGKSDLAGVAVELPEIERQLRVLQELVALELATIG